MKLLIIINMNRNIVDIHALNDERIIMYYGLRLTAVLKC